VEPLWRVHQTAAATFLARLGCGLAGSLDRYAGHLGNGDCRGSLPPRLISSNPPSGRSSPFSSPTSSASPDGPSGSTNRSPALTLQRTVFAGRVFDRFSASSVCPLSSIAKGAFCRGSPRWPPRLAWAGAANDPFKLGLSRLNRQPNMLVCSDFVERERRDSNPRPPA
jgi:hypothetical protein